MPHDQFDITKRWPQEFDPLMHNLYRILASYDGALTDFEEAMKNALASGAQELQDLKITSASDYLWFMNDLLKWIPTENRDGTWVYTHLVVFYWVFNLPPLLHNVRVQTKIIPQNFGVKKPVTAWLIRYAIKMGEFMSTTDSWTPESLKTFQQAEGYNVDWYQGPWKTFNEFFSRHLKVPRTIPEPDNDRVIVSPADCTYQTAMVPVDENSDINVKGVLWNIDKLLSNSGYLGGGEFAGGQFVHAFLKPYDYHRQHAPCSGILRDAVVVQAQCYLEVTEENDSRGLPHLRPVRPIPPPGPPKDPFGPEAPNSTGYQFLQTRGIFIIENDNLGRVAVLPVGMAQVSSVQTDLADKIGTNIKKGDEISWFECGGSDIIMVFEQKAKVKLIVDPGEDAHYLQGDHVIQAHY